MHDPDVFEKPFEFMPERYIKDGKIDKSVPDAEYALFGHGHRSVMFAIYRAHSYELLFQNMSRTNLYQGCTLPYGCVSSRNVYYGRSKGRDRQSSSNETGLVSNSNKVV